MLEYTCIQYLCGFLDLKDLWRLSLTNKSLRNTCVEYVKTNQIVDCGSNQLLAVKLSNQNYKVALNLSGRDNLKDVTMLGGVHTLHLSWCRNLRDVSALGGVHTLDLYWCENLRDVSALGGVHTLVLSECEDRKSVV